MAEVTPKTQLVNFCQKYTRAPVTKEHITYTVTKHGDLCQAIVRVECLDNQEFAGEPMPTQKDAEQSAAQQALENNAHLLASLPEPEKKKKRKAPAEDDGQVKPAKVAKVAAAVQAVVPAGPSGKSELNATMMRILRRPLTKEDTSYTSTQIEGGHQCALQLPSLPAPWCKRTFKGQPSEKKKEAEDAAAWAALEAIGKDPNLGPSVSGQKIGVKAPAGKGTAIAVANGGAWGKGAVNLAAKGAAKGGKVGQWTAAGAKGKGKVKASADLPREPVSGEIIYGDLIEWKGSFGWIKPHEKPSHPMASRRGGKIFVSIKDTVGNVELSQGTVQFVLYADQSGLGAEQAENC